VMHTADLTMGHYISFNQRFIHRKVPSLLQRWAPTCLSLRSKYKGERQHIRLTSLRFQLRNRPIDEQPYLLLIYLLPKLKNRHRDEHSHSPSKMRWDCRKGLHYDNVSHLKRHLLSPSRFLHEISWRQNRTARHLPAQRLALQDLKRLTMLVPLVSKSNNLIDCPVPALMQTSHQHQHQRQTILMLWPHLTPNISNSITLSVHRLTLLCSRGLILPVQETYHIVHRDISQIINAISPPEWAV
jgi:hypothetical protein